MPSACAPPTPSTTLIRPRFLACLSVFGALVVIAAGVAFLAGMWTAHAFFGINPRTFANVSMVSVGDLTIGLTKCLAYGAAIPVISGYCGLTAFGGSEGGGRRDDARRSQFRPWP